MRPPGTSDRKPGVSVQGRTTLTRREREVLELLADGHRAQTIALELGLSVLTVRNHIQAILRKLGCHSQLEAAALARRAVV